MDKTYAPTAPCSGESSRTILDHLADLGIDEEHVALLASLNRFDGLRRKDNLLDEGVASVFGLAGAEVELLALCFHARKFTSAQAALWLAGRGIAPLIFVSNSGRDRHRCLIGRS
jgi:hypothetical protein